MNARKIWMIGAAAALAAALGGIAALTVGGVDALAQVDEENRSASAVASAPPELHPLTEVTTDAGLSYFEDIPGRPDSDRPIIDVLRADDVPVTYEQFLEFRRAADRLLGLCDGEPADCLERAAHADVAMAACMAEKGYYYDPRRAQSLLGLPYEMGTPEALAMDGDTGSGDAYRWEDAGCYGLIAHEFYS
jgi:hypothetical protein